MTSPSDINIAVIGAGPSGFFAAGELFKRLGDRVRVDVIDRLPAPYGLVRYGVAPDHQRTKRVISFFERVAAQAAFSFHGHVEVGRDVTLDELRRFYDAVIFSTGAETNRDLDIPGTGLPGFHNAIDLVAWYNGHPDFQEAAFDFSCERAVIIGNGNVALDIARILAKSPDELRHSDITRSAFDALAESAIHEIVVLGRRGPVQTSFTEPEITEFASLDDFAPKAFHEDLDVNPASEVELTARHADIRARILDILRSFADDGHGRRDKRVVFRFLRSPVEILGSGRVEGLRIVKNRLEGEPHDQRAVSTSEEETMDCGLVISSIGYRGMRIPGVPFDEGQGTLPHKAGRVLRNGAPVTGLYTTGWIKRGARGLIGHNKPDCAETVQSIVEDLPVLRARTDSSDPSALTDLLKRRGVRVVNYEQWQAIDAAEIERGRRLDKPREKFTSVAEMLAAAGV